MSAGQLEHVFSHIKQKIEVVVVRDVDGIIDIKLAQKEAASQKTCWVSIHQLREGGIETSKRALKCFDVFCDTFAVQTKPDGGIRVRQTPKQNRNQQLLHIYMG